MSFSPSWRPRLSLVIPTRNEAGNVMPLDAALRSALEGVDYEVIVVDDSTDAATRPLLRELASSSGWRVVERPPAAQSGLGTAVAEGIGLARGAAVCVMDGDLQHPPQVARRLLAEVEAGAGLAVASRYIAGGSAVGLSSRARRLVSRGTRRAAYTLFPESWRTTDPLSGFFCVRRDAVDGLLLRPVGFKILLELLVLCPGLRVVDVPFTFGARHEGVSKASMREGLLYLRHLGSLFFQVPLSASHLKFALITAISLAFFDAVFAALMRATTAMLLVWIVASIGSSVLNALLQRKIAFRRPENEALLYRAFGLTGSVLGLLLYVAMMAVYPAHPMVLGTVAQAFALIVPLLFSLSGFRAHLRRLIRADVDIAQFAKRVHADHAWWAAGPSLPAAAPATLVPAGLGELISRCAANRRPGLLVEPLSFRPQPRRNVETLSAILVPAPAQGDVQVAVLVRRHRRPFRPADLQQAVTWAETVRRSTADLPRAIAGSR